MKTDKNEIIHEVEPARLNRGKWSNRKNKMIGEGDISASYSADKIAYGQPVSKPFEWRGKFWVSVGNAIGRGRENATAYRLASPVQYDGMPLSYGEKTADGEAARNDPNGFYHGMLVKWKGKPMVLCGPPVVFVAGVAAQLNMFDF